MNVSRKIKLGLLASLTAATLVSAPAFAQQPAKPNIIFIMGDDIGWMQPSIYHRGLMVGETPNIDRIGQEGAMFTDYVADAKLHVRPQCLLHRHVSAAHGHDPASTARQSVLFAARHSGGRQVPARSRLQHRRVRQEPSGRPHRGAADGPWLPGILGLSLSPRCDAAGELPGHQQDPDHSKRSRRRAGTRRFPAFREVPRRRRSQDDDLSDAAAPCPVVQVVGRHRKEPDVQRRGPADARALGDGGRGNLGQGHRLPRPQRPQEDQQAVLRLVQPGAHACRRPCCRRNTRRWWASVAARIGASTKPA